MAQELLGYQPTADGREGWRVMRHGVDVDHRLVGNPKRKV
jgi:hypothetical protein